MWVLVRIVIYLFILSYLLTKLKSRNLPLSNKEAIVAFLFKCLLGCLYGYIHLNFYGGDDTWVFNAQSLEEFQTLKENPLLFIRNIWPAWITNRDTLVEYISRNLETNVTIKLLATFNILSGGNYYINVLFFNFVLFWGHYWLFSFLVKQFPGKRKSLLIGIFFLPPFVFWLSGIRGDGLILFFLSLLFIQFHKWMKTSNFGHLVLSVFCLLGIFIFRSAIVLVILPFLIGWYISTVYTKKPLGTYLLTYLVAVLIFFISPAFGLDLPSLVVQKQKEFLALPGKTRFDMQPLEPGFTAFAKAIPSAIRNTLVRPYLWEVKGLLQVVTAVETTLFLLFILVSLPFIKWKALAANPWICGIFFFSASMFVFIGLTIPYPGAIIRYKVISELLLCVAILLSVYHIRKKMI